MSKFTKKEIRESMCLYAVSDSMWLNGRTLPDVIREALEGGATFMQIREKELPYHDFLALAKEVKKVTDEFGVPYVVNDEVEIAKEIDADGVHIGQSDKALVEVRQMLGPDKIIGVSAQTVAQAVEAEKNGADYLGVGSIFTTSTKPDADDVPLETLKDICDAVSIPVVAIGGIQFNNIMDLVGTNVDGIAVVSGIFGAADIKNSTKKLLEASKELVAKKDNRYLLFDVDGVLIDSMPIWENSANVYLSKVHGIEAPSDVDKHCETLSLLEAGAYIKELYPQITLSPKEIADDVAMLIREEYWQVAERPYMVETIKELKQRGYHLYLATASEYTNVKGALENLGVWHCFDALFTCTDIGYSKSYVEYYQEIANRLGLACNDLVMIEDSLHSIQTAKKAGLKVVGVFEETSADRQEEIKNVSDIYIQNLSELIRRMEVYEKNT